MRTFILCLLLVFSPFVSTFAQDGYDDGGYYDDSGYDDAAYDDEYYDDGYYDDEEYYDDEYYDDAAEEQPPTDAPIIVPEEKSPVGFHMGAIIRGGYQGILLDTGFESGGVFEAMLNVDLYYVYFQAGVGWSSYWSKLGQEKAAAGGQGSDRSGTAFNEGLYLGLGFGAVIPQIGLRIGGGFQMSLALLGHISDIGFSDEILPYVEIAYDYKINDYIIWTTSVRSLIAAARLVNYLPSSGRQATIEIQTGFLFNFF